jgi:hypothetical protein
MASQETAQAKAEKTIRATQTLAANIMAARKREASFNISQRRRVRPVAEAMNPWGLTTERRKS